MKSIGTTHFPPSTDTFKAAIAERCIRSFKDLLHKALTATVSHRYIDFLQKVADTMNSRKNRTINKAPRDVNDGNIYEVWHRQYLKHKKLPPSKVIPLNQGDSVRLSKNRGFMEKGFLPNYTDEIFKIVTIIARKPHTVYRIEDSLGNKIDGIFYASELQKVKAPGTETVFRIEKILKRRKRGGIWELLVAWKGFSKEHNSWIAETDLIGDHDSS